MNHISAHILQQAIELYFVIAYPNGGAPAGAQERVAAIRALAPSENVPEELLEKESGVTVAGFALRLGQPMYPHMKLIVEPAPAVLQTDAGVLLRVDAHDRHLHAPAGSADEAWLATIRASNKELGERIEGEWSKHGLPTFKEYLRNQLAARKAQRLDH